MRHRKAFYCVWAVVIAVVLVGCVWYFVQALPLGEAPDPQVLIDTETLKVTHSGPKTTVFDCVGNDEYVFITKRVRRSEGISEPHRAIATDTVQIDTLPGGGLRIADLTAGEVYRITPKRG